MGSFEIEEIRCIVSGRVQGVMYRDFVKRHARHLGLVGFVRNLSDGTVEVLAQGEREKLEQLLAHLRKGPLFSSVAKVDVERRPPTEIFSLFEIR